MALASTVIEKSSKIKWTEPEFFVSGVLAKLTKTNSGNVFLLINLFYRGSQLLNLQGGGRPISS